MFEKMRKCLDDFEEIAKKNELTRDEDESLIYFYINFAKAMLSECPDAHKVARVIMVEHGLFDDIKIKFGK